MQFRKAERKKAKARIGLAGPAGSGKTYSALLTAKGLGEKIAFIDTENGSGDLYANICNYDILNITAPFTPDKYIQAIKAAEEAGYGTIIIDSLSHAWAGEGGLLDLQGKITDSGKANSYSAWRFVTPKHNAMVEAILQSKCHIIATMRSKIEYIQTIGNGGKTEIKKVGLAPIQRDGMEYEFTIFFELGQDHNANTTKDRTSLFDGQYFTPSVKTGETIKAWLESGVDVKAETEYKPNKVESLIQKLDNASNSEELKDKWTKLQATEEYKTLALLEKEQIRTYKDTLKKAFENNGHPILT
jgi:hypothetical protein